MQIESIKLHPEFPEKVWVIVEQPRGEPIRLAYDPESHAFKPTEYKSLIYHRGFQGCYGWIGGSGIPPQPHFDVLFLTNCETSPGDVLEGYICGVFVRRDGDHKFVALDVDLRHTVSSPDLSAVDKAVYENLISVYPEVGEGEGWFGAEFAQEYLRNNRAFHD